MEGSAKLGTLCALVPYMYRTLHALVLHVFCAQRSLMPHMSHVLSALLLHMPCASRVSCHMCSRALLSCSLHVLVPVVSLVLDVYCVLHTLMHLMFQEPHFFCISDISPPGVH